MKVQIPLLCPLLGFTALQAWRTQQQKNLPKPPTVERTSQKPLQATPYSNEGKNLSWGQAVERIKRLFFRS